MSWFRRFMVLCFAILFGIVDLWGMEEDDSTPCSVSSSFSPSCSELNLEDLELSEYNLSPFGVSSPSESEEDSDEPLDACNRQASEPIDIPTDNKEIDQPDSLSVSFRQKEEKLLSNHLQYIPHGNTRELLTYESLIRVLLRELRTLEERVGFIKSLGWLVDNRNELSDCIDAMGGVLMVPANERKIFLYQLVLVSSWLSPGEVLPGWIIYKVAEINSNLQSIFFRRLTLWLSEIEDVGLFNISPHLDEKTRFSSINIALYFAQKWFKGGKKVFPKNWVLASLERSPHLWKKVYNGFRVLIPSLQKTNSENDLEAALTLLSASQSPLLVANLAQSAANVLEEKLDFQLLSFLAILSKIPNDHVYYQSLLLEILKSKYRRIDGLYVLNELQGYALQKKCEDVNFTALLKEVYEKSYKIEDPDERFIEIKQILSKKWQILSK